MGIGVGDRVAGSAAPPAPRPMVITLAFCGIVVALMQTLIAPLLPSLPRLAHTDAGTASWMVTATLITGCVANPVFGRIGDMYGKRRMILVSLASMSIGSVICGVSSDIGLLITGRALQGAALALIPLGVSIIRDELPTERVPSAVAVVGATLGTGAAIGFPVAAVLVEYSNWHTMFWVSAAVGLIDIGLVLRYVPESPNRTSGRFDVAGAIGLSTALVSLLVGVEKAPTWGWTSTSTLACFALAVLVGLGWGAWEMRSHTPLVDLRVSARRPVLLTNLAATLIGFSFYANSLATAQLVQESTATGYGLAESIVVAGLCILPAGLLQASLAPLVARMARTRGPKTALALGGLIMAAGYAYRIPFSHDLPNVVIGTTIVGAGTALAYSTLSLLIMQAVPITETAAANGLNTLMRSIGQAVCSAVVASVLASVTLRISSGGLAPTLWAYQLIFVFAGLAALGAFALALAIPGRRLDDRSATEPDPFPAAHRPSIEDQPGPPVSARPAD
jgi:MFS family permease